MTSNLRKIRSGALVAIAAIAGCTGGGQSVMRLTSTVPEPVVEPLELNVGVFYDESFQNYETTETTAKGKEWRLIFGDAHVRVFDTILKSLFAEVATLESVDPQAIAGFDVVLQPSIDNFSMLLPRESGTEFFAVSMRYFIDMLDGGGQSRGIWELNAYGRSNSKLFGGNYEMLQQATIDAWRDVAATLVVGLPEQLQLSGLLELPDEEPEGQAESTP